ncbi:hypothetical protein [Singapore grouper iridovirus]|nr:hypothetical protein [Singapore grouper iridovirus]
MGWAIVANCEFVNATGKKTTIPVNESWAKYCWIWTYKFPEKYTLLRYSVDGEMFMRHRVTFFNANGRYITHTHLNHGLEDVLEGSLAVPKDAAYARIHAAINVSLTNPGDVHMHYDETEGEQIRSYDAAEFARTLAAV